MSTPMGRLAWAGRPLVLYTTIYAKHVGTRRIMPDRLSRILSSIAIVFSLISVFISTRTYLLSQRPYLGISSVRHSYELEGKNVKRIRWEIVFKNTGSLPASGRVETRNVSVTSRNKVFPVPLKSIKEASLFVMPGTEGVLHGDFPENEHVPIQEVLAGKATLNDLVRISYEPSKAAWWRSSYFLRR